MSAKEKLLERVRRSSEAEADETLRLPDAREDPVTRLPDEAAVEDEEISAEEEVAVQEAGGGPAAGAATICQEEIERRHVAPSPLSPTRRRRRRAGRGLGSRAPSATAEFGSPEALVGSGVVGTMKAMTTREKFDRLVDQMSEPSLRAEYARLLREREIDRQVVGSYERTPQFEPDGWADLKKVNEASRDAVLGRLDEEERAAGLEPW